MKLPHPCIRMGKGRQTSQVHAHGVTNRENSLQMAIRKKTKASV